METVCCMCGDVGFPDKLFRCGRCLSRFQHSYCSNYCEESSSEMNGGVCDWCRSEEMRAHQRKMAGKSDAGAGASNARSEYTGAGNAIKQNAAGGRGGKPVTASAPARPAGRRMVDYEF
ncbi:hypothetical protein QJS10_CPA10g00902 [Acorus calamus]|uniref:PHD-type zinc finger plants domain-containing protein n=1 Tax=Acorus calamus TaxID=4465 RepID=A0AAV9E0I8_ACOCL|nr:hypothetical protein QJS10_CPA10g00902 [Acorus calamus]